MQLKFNESTNKMHALIPYKEADVVFVVSTTYHSAPIILATPKRAFYIVYNLLNAFNKYRKLEKVILKFFGNVQMYAPQKLSFRNRGIKLWPIVRSKLIDSIMHEILGTFNNVGSFGIFSSNFIRKQAFNLFEENFINGFEDIWLSFEIYLNNNICTSINYRIGDLIGSTLGDNIMRELRNIPNALYFAKIVKNASNEVNQKLTKE